MNASTFVTTMMLIGIQILMLLGPQEADAQQIKTTELAIYPTGAPRAALRYRLLPSLLDRTDLNAAPIYLKTLLMLEGQEGARLTKEEWQDVLEWLETPTPSLPIAEVKTTLERVSNVLEGADLAARRSRCEWDTAVPELKDNLYGILLPEMASMRNLGRLVGLRTRFAIAQGDFDLAVRSLQTGYAMARHCGQQPFLVSGLVGMAVARIMNDQVEEFVAAKGAPNLFWALTTLPRPLVSMRKGYELESVGIYLAFPELAEARTADKTSEEWDAALNRTLERFRSSFGLLENPDSDGGAKAIAVKMFEAAAILAQAGKARAGLIARGYDRKNVEKMAASQAILIYTAQVHDELRDAGFKWFHVPYSQARTGLRDADKLVAEAKQLEIIPLASNLLPAVSAVRRSQANFERDIDMLCIVEALRIYADSHEGKLPDALTDIREIPIPANPKTGEAFGYRIEEDAAVLEAVTSGDKPVRFRIEVAK